MSTMTDAEWIANLDGIASPREALECIVENEGFFGVDPYYRDLRDAMLKMAHRVLQSPMSHAEVCVPPSWWAEVAGIVVDSARRAGEDVIGLLLKRGAFHRLIGDKECVLLAKMIEDHAAKENE